MHPDYVILGYLKKKKKDTIKKEKILTDRFNLSKIPLGGNNFFFCLILMECSHLLLLLM